MYNVEAFVYGPIYTTPQLNTHLHTTLRQKIHYSAVSNLFNQYESQPMHT